MKKRTYLPKECIYVGLVLIISIAILSCNKEPEMLSKVELEDNLDSTDPDSTDPDSTDPDSTDPDSTDPDSTDPDSTDPDSTDPDSTDPDSTDPDSTDPDSTDPDSTDPIDWKEVSSFDNWIKVFVPTQHKTYEKNVGGNLINIKHFITNQTHTYLREETSDRRFVVYDANNSNPLYIYDVVSNTEMEVREYNNTRVYLRVNVERDSDGEIAKITEVEYDNLDFELKTNIYYYDRVGDYLVDRTQEIVNKIVVSETTFMYSNGKLIEENTTSPKITIKYEYHSHGYIEKVTETLTDGASIITKVTEYDEYGVALSPGV